MASTSIFYRKSIIITRYRVSEKKKKKIRVTFTDEFLFISQRVFENRIEAARSQKVYPPQERVKKIVDVQLSKTIQSMRSPPIKLAIQANA